MTPSDLKYHVEQTGQEPHFFDRATMRFFGDTMRNFGVRRVTVSGYSDEINPETGKYEIRKFDCWELYRKRAVKHGNRGSFYFRTDNFHRIHGVGE